MKHDNDNKALRFLSVCSGIEAASVAWPQWEAVAFAEIEKFPSAVLTHHYPDVPNLGDFTKIDTSTLGRVDILCGGTPCQAFSVAGARRGLADERGNLTLSFVELAHELAGHGKTAGNGLRNVVWENVPGVLSDKGNAFGCFLAGLVGADDPILPLKRWTSYGMVSGPKGRAAWAVKDAQFYGLAQRRKRVIVVADFGNGADPAAVLFEPESVYRNTPPSREAGKAITGTLKACAGSGGWSNSADHTAAGLMISECAHVAPTISSRSTGGGGLGTDFDLDGGLVKAFGIPGNWIGRKPENGGNAIEPMVEVSPCLTKTDRHGVVHAAPVAPTLDANYGRLQGHDNQHIDGGAGLFVAGAICRDSFTGGAGGRPEGATAGHFIPVAFGGDVARTLSARHDSSPCADRGMDVVADSSYAVRRLTPTECERLQGFPDGYTDIPWRGQSSSPDGPRYKALGNSWAVPKFKWLGERIARLMPGTFTAANLIPANENTPPPH